MLGILLLAHGSRDPVWREPVEAVARQIAEREPGVRTRCAYLELAAPDLATAAAQLLQDGATRLRVVPLFLGMGHHVREDLPRRVAQLRELHPGMEIVLRPAAGQHAGLIRALASIALEEPGEDRAIP